MGKTLLQAALPIAAIAAPAAIGALGAGGALGAAAPAMGAFGSADMLAAGAAGAGPPARHSHKANNVLNSCSNSLPIPSSCTTSKANLLPVIKPLNSASAIHARNSSARVF